MSQKISNLGTEREMNDNNPFKQGRGLACYRSINI